MTPRRPSTVSLDLRVPGRVAAVAADKRGALSAWAVVSDDERDGGGRDPVALAKLAVEKLGVRPTAVKVLLGSKDAQVGVFTGPGPPGESEIAEALLAEGYERLAEPAVAALRVSRQEWLVAASAGETVDQLSEGLSEIVLAEPAFVVDQLLAADALEAGRALAELGEAGLMIAALPHDSAPSVRCLSPPVDPEQAAREVVRTLDTARVEGDVRVLGSERSELRRTLAESGFEAEEEPMPICGSQTLPAGLELAWRLALDPDPPRLDAPRLEKRRTSLLWARRVMRAALALGLLGALLVVYGLRSSWVSRAENKALRTEASGLERQVEQLKEAGALAEKIARARADLAGKSPPWPRVAERIAALARDLPPGVGWERLAIVDGTLELEASATGPTALRDLELMRWTLERSPGIINLSWDEPETDPGRIGIRQVFRASLQEPAPVERQGAP